MSGIIVEKNISKMVCIEQTTGPTRLTNIIIDYLDDTVKLLDPEYLDVS